MKILFLTTLLPFNTKSGGEVVSQLFIENLMEFGYSVDVLGYLRKSDKESNKPADMHLVKKIVIESSSSKLFVIYNIIKSYIYNQCYSAQKYTTRAYIKSIYHFLKNNDYEWIIIDHFQMGWVLKYLPPNIKIASIGHNMESDLYKQLAENADMRKVLRYIYKREANKMLLLENKIINRSQFVWLLTEENKSRYSELFQSSDNKLKAVCIPPTNTINKIDQVNYEKRWDIGLIGTWSWDANQEGLKWFFDKVYPLLPKTVSICIAGIGADWLLNKYENVSYIGFVENANKFMKESRVIAIPSITGDGIQIKTLHAISLGLQIVATSFALRGINNPPSYVFKADDSVAFKEQLLHMISHLQINTQEALSWCNSRRQKFIKDMEIIKSAE